MIYAHARYSDKLFMGSVTSGPNAEDSINARRQHSHGGDPVWQRSDSSASFVLPNMDTAMHRVAPRRTEAIVLGKGPIRINGKTVGYVTSADYGYSVSKQIAYGYLPIQFTIKGQPATITCFGKEQAATASHDPLFDQGMTRIKT